MPRPSGWPGTSATSGNCGATAQNVGILLQQQALALPDDTSGSAADLDRDATVAPMANAAVPPLVLGKDLADQIGVQVGDQVVVTSPQGELNPVIGLVPKFQPFKVVGIFHSGFYQYDSGMAFIGLADAQRLFDEPDLLSVISFKVDNLNHAPQIGREIEQAAGKGFMTTNWMEQNRELFRALELEQIVTFIVIALIVIVAALNILIALTMMVMEKTRDIAVMMSFGVEPGQVRRIFLMEGLLISLVGTALGLALGYLPPGRAGITTSFISRLKSTQLTRCHSPRAHSTALLSLLSRSECLCWPPFILPRPRPACFLPKHCATSR